MEGASLFSLGRTLCDSHTFSNSAQLESLRVGGPKPPQTQKCQTSMHDPSGHPIPFRPLEGGSARLPKQPTSVSSSLELKNSAA